MVLGAAEPHRGGPGAGPGGHGPPQGAAALPPAGWVITTSGCSQIGPDFRKKLKKSGNITFTTLLLHYYTLHPTDRMITTL